MAYTDFSTVNSIDTSTLVKLQAKTIDTVVNWSPLTVTFLSKAKKWSGSRFKIPVKYQQNNNGTSFNGLQQFSTNTSDNFVNMQFDPTGREQPTNVAGIQMDVNKTQQVTDLLKRQMQSDAHDLADYVAGKFWTLQTGIEFLSVLDGVDDGTLGASSYGGLSRSTYTTLKGNLTSGVGSLTQVKMATAYNNATHGPFHPNLVVCDKATWSYYEKLLLPTLNTQVVQTGLTGYPMFTGVSGNGVANLSAAGTDLKGASGFTALTYKGMPVVADDKAPSGYMVMLRTDDWGFYGLDATLEGYKASNILNSPEIEGVYAIGNSLGFAFSGFQVPINQYAISGHTILMGNLICNNPRNQAILYGITGA